MAAVPVMSHNVDDHAREKEGPQTLAKLGEEESSFGEQSRAPLAAQAAAASAWLLDVIQDWAGPMRLLLHTPGKRDLGHCSCRQEDVLETTTSAQHHALLTSAVFEHRSDDGDSELCSDSTPAATEALAQVDEPQMRSPASSGHPMPPFVAVENMSSLVHSLAPASGAHTSILNIQR